MTSTKEIKALISHVADRVSFSKGIYTAKKSYYWGLTKDGSDFANKVMSLIPNAEQIDYGKHYHGFVGGAKTCSEKDSYFYVKFKVL